MGERRESVSHCTNIKIHHGDEFYCFSLNPSTQIIQIKRLLKQFHSLKVKEMQLTLHKRGRKLKDNSTLKQQGINDGDQLDLQLRIPGTNHFEPIEVVDAAIF